MRTRCLGVSWAGGRVVGVLGGLTAETTVAGDDLGSAFWGQLGELLAGYRSVARGR